MGTCAFILALALAVPEAHAGTHKLVPIYVGPVVRHGVADSDRGVLDAIATVRMELGKDHAFTVVADEGAASVKLYIVSRGEVPGTSGLTDAPKEKQIKAVLQVGSYERVLAGQSAAWTSPNTWTRCARLLVKDVKAWVDANQERIP